MTESIAPEYAGQFVAAVAIEPSEHGYGPPGNVESAPPTAATAGGCTMGEITTSGEHRAFAAWISAALHSFGNVRHKYAFASEVLFAKIVQAPNPRLNRYGITSASNSSRILSRLDSAWQLIAMSLDPSLPPILAVLACPSYQPISGLLLG
jgi:hypothetical protein